MNPSLQQTSDSLAGDDKKRERKLGFQAHRTCHVRFPLSPDFDDPVVLGSVPPERLAPVGPPRSGGAELTALAISAVGSTISNSKRLYPSPSPTGGCFRERPLLLASSSPIGPFLLPSTDPNLG
jgi:hypothetical protein